MVRPIGFLPAHFFGLDMLSQPFANEEIGDVPLCFLFDLTNRQLGTDFWFAYHFSGPNQPRFDMKSGNLWCEYPETWSTYYRDNQLHEVDPVLRYAPRTTFAVTWERLSELFCRNGDCRGFLDAARDHGIQSGVCLATRQVKGDMQIISFACRDQKTYSDRELSLVTYYGQLIGHKISRICSESDTEGRPDVSLRALECLELCALGKTSSEIADIIGISRHTVDFHIRNAMAALGSSTRTYAVVRAVQMGLLHPK
jgi:LuxR family transcriptional regulator, quorum-sensing system regulator CciR